MAYFHLLRQTILFAMLIVVSAKIIWRDLNVAFHFCRIDQRVLYFAFFWNRVGIARLMTFVEGLELSIGRMQTLLYVVLLENCVLKFDLGVLFHELVVNLSIVWSGAAGNQSLKLANQNLVGNDLVFKLRRSQAVALQEVIVFLLSDEVPTGEECGRIATVHQLVFDFVLRNPQPETVRLSDKSNSFD